MTIEVNDKYIGELYMMVSDYCHQRGNTFHYIKRAIEERYPEIARKNQPVYD